MNNKNYQIMMEKEIEAIKKEGRKPSLLLHSCCAPCSSSVLERMADIFDITLYYYNPNIYPEEEYVRRGEELKKLVDVMGLSGKVKIIIEEYDESEFLIAAKGLEKEKEGWARCTECFRLRIGKTGEKAGELGFDYFTTTLTVGRHKNSKKINTVAEEIEKAVGVRYLYSDFKKKDGCERSNVLAEQYNIYKQEYCGCRFSLEPAAGQN